jgi:hypothetical protein
MATENAHASVPYSDEPKMEQDNTDHAIQSTTADLVTAIDRLTDKITALESRFQKKTSTYDPTIAQQLAVKSLPARVAIWYNLPLCSIIFILTLPQYLPLPVVPVLIWYETRHNPLYLKTQGKKPP